MNNNTFFFIASIIYGILSLLISYILFEYDDHVNMLFLHSLLNIFDPNIMSLFGGIIASFLSCNIFLMLMGILFGECIFIAISNDITPTSSAVGQIFLELGIIVTIFSTIIVFFTGNLIGKVLNKLAMKKAINESNILKDKALKIVVDQTRLETARAKTESQIPQASRQP